MDTSDENPTGNRAPAPGAPPTIKLDYERPVSPATPTASDLLQGTIALLCAFAFLLLAVAPLSFACTLDTGLMASLRLLLIALLMLAGSYASFFTAGRYLTGRHRRPRKDE